MSTRALAEGLFRSSDGAPKLLGGRRKSDGRYAFPPPQGAMAEQYDIVELATEGSLWSFTVQRFRPKPPYAGPGDETSFKPYAVGYVELPGQIIVESLLKTDDFARLRIGQPMKLTVTPFGIDPDGTETVTYAFEPV